VPTLRIIDPGQIPKKRRTKYREIFEAIEALKASQVLEIECEDENRTYILCCALYGIRRRDQDLRDIGIRRWGTTIFVQREARRKP
jgi:hypothetical protein